MDLIISNIVETFEPFLCRFARQQSYDDLVEAERRLESRAIYWGSDDKLVVMSRRSDVCEMASRLGIYRRIESVVPVHSSSSLCRDLLADDGLLHTILDRCASSASVILKAYAVTEELEQLALKLRSHCGHLVFQEGSTRSGVRVGRFFDTKAGFRQLMEEWRDGDPDLAIPPGYTCTARSEVIAAVDKFLQLEKSCIVKPDRGESGIGLIWVDAHNPPTLRDLDARIDAAAAFGDEPVIVEERVLGPQGATSSPSVEVQVTEAGVHVTYVCAQLVSETGEFLGTAIGRDVLADRLALQLECIGEKVGIRLADLGYRGHFDIDFVIDEHGRPIAVEANTRRTGGTHAHDLALYLCGENYAATRSVISRDIVLVARPAETLELMFASYKYQDDVRFVPTVLPTEKSNSIGYVAIGPSLHAIADAERRILQLERP